MKNFKLLYILVILFIATACEQDVIETPRPITPVVEMTTEGSADFSNFVALGNSLTAGYQAGALFTEGQNNSLPHIIWKQIDEQFKDASFDQPTINSEHGYYGMAGGTVLGRLLLQGTPPAPRPTISTQTSVPSPANPAFNYTGEASELNNFGVPGILLGQALIPQTGDWSLLGTDPRVNPYYARFASDPGNSTLLGDALSANPSFFLFWLGNNDVLGYATTGASGAIPLTSQAAFAAQYDMILSALTTNPDVKGVVGNIPNVTSIPFFHAIRWNAISFDDSDPVDAGTITALNNAFSGFNAALDGLVGFGAHPADDAARRKVSYANGSNPILIRDKYLEDLSPKFDMLQGAGAISAEERAALQPYVQARPITSNDLVTLSAGSVLGTLAVPDNPSTVIGVAIPLADQYVLTTEEQVEVSEAIEGFNGTIANEVAKYNNRVALANVNQGLADLSASGFAVYNGVVITPNFVPPTGAFSEDGVHPNSRGYAYAANIFIDAINAKFGSDIPAVNIGHYKGVALPINP